MNLDWYAELHSYRCGTAQANIKWLLVVGVFLFISLEICVIQIYILRERDREEDEKERERERERERAREREREREKCIYIYMLVYIHMCIRQCITHNIQRGYRQLESMLATSKPPWFLVEAWMLSNSKMLCSCNKNVAL